MMAILGWALAFVALALALHGRRRLRASGELVARASHELRGPLTAAALAIHAAGREGELARPRVAAVELELRRAAVALDDLSAAPARRRRHDDAERVDVASLLATQLEAWQAVAQARGCELRLVGPAGGAVVRGDCARIAQATGNVLANALEHGGGTVEVATHVAGGRVRIEVADGGPGLPAPVAELVRRPKAGRGARGRGLAIAADIAARHGGCLAASRGDAGARIAIDLPAFTESPDATPAHDRSAVGAPAPDSSARPEAA